MKSSIKAILAALLLIPALISGQQLNPNPDACCDCLTIVNAEENDPQNPNDIGPYSNFPQLVFDTDGTASVKVKIKHKGGTNCTKTLTVTVGARSQDMNQVHPTTHNISVAVGATSAPLEFVFTEEQFRLNGEWEIFFSCDESSNGNTSSGECSETYKVKKGGCSSCESGTCQDTGDITFYEDGSFNFFTTTFNGDGNGFLHYSPDGTENGGELSHPGMPGLTPIIPKSGALTKDQATGAVTQIATGNTTMDIAPANSSLLAADPKAFVVNHKNSAGVTFRSTSVALVEEGGMKRFRVDSTFDGATTRHEQFKPTVNTRILQKGRMVSGTFTPLRQTTYVRNENSPGKRVYRITVQERPNASAPWETISDIETSWERQILGWVKTKEIIDPDGVELTSTWTYYQPGSTTGLAPSNESSGGSSGEGSSNANPINQPSYRGVGRLKQYQRYDGYQAFFTYGLHETTMATPYAGNPSGRLVRIKWFPMNQTYTTSTYINGILVAQESAIHGATSLTRPRLLSSSTSGSSSGTLTQSAKYRATGGGNDFGGKPESNLNEDGTLTTYSYTRLPGGGYTTVTDNGSTTNGTTVAKGTRTTTTVNSRGTTILRKTEAIGYGTGNVIFDSMAVTSVDAVGRALVTAYYPETVTVTGEVAAVSNPAWITTTEYSCCGIASQTDRTGVKTFYAYDGLQRRIKSNTLGVTTETHYKGLTTENHRYPETVSASLSPTLAGSSSTIISKSVRDISGTLLESWNPDLTSATNGVLVKSTTQTTYLNPKKANTIVPNLGSGVGQRTVTTTPDNYSQTTDSFFDGRTARTYGDLSPAMEYAYTVNTTGEFTKMAYVSGDSYFEAQGSQSDWDGRTLQSGSLTPGTGAVGSLASAVFSSSVLSEYNSLGQMVKSTDPDGITTLMAYNAEGEQTLTAIDLNQNDNIDYGIDTVQFSETTPALDASNIPVWKTITKIWQPGDTSPSGGTIVSTSMQSANGLSSASQTIGVANPSTSVTTLGGNGNWTTTNTAPDGTKSVTTYTNGRMVSMASLASDNSVIESQSQGYDSLNRPVTSTHSRTGTTTTTYLSNTADIVTSMTDADNRVTAISYDVRGRQISVNAPDTLDANNNTLANVTNTIYNPDNTVAETTGDQTYRTTHTYDYADRQISMTTYGTETATTTWTYSSDRGFLTRKQYADGKGTDYTYTAAGRLATRAWARGVITTYTYDSGGRLVLTNYSDSTPDVTMSYDAMGRQVSQSNGIATSTFAYNTGNLQIDTETITYDFNADNTVDFARVIARSQDALGRESGWQLKAGTTVENSASYGFSTLHGRLTSVTGPNNDAHVYGYLPNSNLISTVTNTSHIVTNVWEANRNVLVSKENKVGSTVISKYEYGVNDFGQRTNVSQTGTAFAATRSIAWGYNSKGEVVKADHSDTAQSRAYLYDGIGNRLSGGGLNPPSQTTYVPNALNQYSAIGSLTPVHDDDGNATAYPLPANLAANSTLVWDGENRLIEVQQAGTSVPLVRYAYDSQSRRIAETVGSNTTVYVYDGWNPIAEYWRAGLQPATLTKTYLWGMDLSGSMQGAGGVGGLLSVSLLSSVSESSVFFPTYDGNGNVSEYLDSTGSLVAHYEYDPFGKTTVSVGSKASDFAHRFSTKPLDSVTKLYYYGYRWYDSETGRWPSRDPIGERGGVSLYRFGPNSPISGFDFLGWVWFSTAPATPGTWGTKIPKDLQDLVNRDYGGKKVEPGPPTGNCSEDLAKTIAWWMLLERAGYPTTDAENRLKEVIEQCRKRPEPPLEIHDPAQCACDSESGRKKTVITWKRVVTEMRDRPNIDLALSEPGDPINLSIPPGGLTHSVSTSEVPEEWILLKTKVTWGTMFEFSIQGTLTKFYDDYLYTWGCMPLGKNKSDYPEIDDRRNMGYGHQK